MWHLIGLLVCLMLSRAKVLRQRLLVFFLLVPRDLVYSMAYCMQMIQFKVNGFRYFECNFDQLLNSVKQ